MWSQHWENNRMKNKQEKIIYQHGNIIGRAELENQTMISEERNTTNRIEMWFQDLREEDFTDLKG